MQYRHAPEANHAALDAVLASAPGRPTLPVRLTVELFGRARAHLGSPATVAVWDPCCGAGVSLTVLGLLRPGISVVVGTDVDPDPLDLARRNLALLAPGGLAARASELDDLAVRHGKDSYTTAAVAARELSPRSTPERLVAVADARDPVTTRAVLGDIEPDIVLADLPHGRQTSWFGQGSTDGAGQGSPDGTEARRDRPGAPDPRGQGATGATTAAEPGPAPEVVFLRAVARVLAPQAVVVAVGRGRSVPLPSGVRALEKVRVGHRAAVLLRAGDLFRPSR